MQFKLRSRRWYAAGVAILLTASIAATKSVTPDCPLTIAKAWVSAHPNELPKTLGEVTQFPAAYQLVIMRSLPATTQSTIWREHIANVKRTMRLNDEQERLLRLVDDSLDSWIAAKVPPVTLGTKGEIYKRIRSTFPDTSARALFLTLGASGKGTMAIRTASMFSAVDVLFSIRTVQSGIRAVFGSGSISKALAPTPPCSCSGQSNWCGRFGGQEQLCLTWLNCEMSGGGCGTFGFYPCDGICANEV